MINVCEQLAKQLAKLANVHDMMAVRNVMRTCRDASNLHTHAYSEILVFLLTVMSTIRSTINDSTQSSN